MIKYILILLLPCVLAYSNVCNLAVSVSNDASLPIINISFSLDKGATVYSDSISVVFPEEIAADKLQSPPADLQEQEGQEEYPASFRPLPGPDVAKMHIQQIA